MFLTGIGGGRAPTFLQKNVITMSTPCRVLKRSCFDVGTYGALLKSIPPSELDDPYDAAVRKIEFR